MSVIDVLFGKPLATQEEAEQRIGTLAGIPLLGLDALASAAYGPEAALTVLLPLGAIGLVYFGPVIAVIIVLLSIVYFSYRQTIAAYPHGGGSYTVASKNLGTFSGLVAAAALMLDYLLVVAVGISAGVGALVSAFPILHPYILPLDLAILGFIALVNLRGVRESGLVFIMPTYLFIGSILLVLAIGIIKTLGSGGQPVPVVAPPVVPPTTTVVSLWLLLHAFASGCTAMTGVEAVSNGVTAFRAPAVRYAQRTLTVIILVLALMLAGLAFLVNVYHIGATVPGEPGYESLLSQLIGAVMGKGIFYYVTIAAILAVLSFSANTAFAGFPRLCRIVAQDDYLPHGFAELGRRLVLSEGILVLTVAAAILLIAFRGITDNLIPLFAVGAFLAFTISQAGMVAHWRRVGGKNARRNMLINGVGAAATAVTLGVVLIAKFTSGAWLTVLIIPGILLIFRAVKRHYAHVRVEIAHPAPLNVSHLNHPIVVVPIREWNTLAHKALRFALNLSSDIYAVQVITTGEMDILKSKWDKLVVKPAESAGLAPPQLVVLESPYRKLYRPIDTFISELKTKYPGRQIAVIVPELVERHWYHYFFHNQQGETLKFRLLARGDQDIVIINIPWYLKE